ncbi:hypothetical protein EGT07_09825 [Herbaspirillum sp. HC18]|nr:hypothetical protein EGT07_09825 [Herbaspirillum sp. HC18]
MNKILGCGAALALAFGACQSHAQQSYSSAELDSLYERGQREMAPNWRGLGKTHEAAVFIHNDVRKADNGLLAVWMHYELPAPEYVEKEKSYLSTRDRMLVDCKSSRTGTTDSTYYADRFAHGAVVLSNRKKPEMMEVVPDSIEELLLKTACAAKPRSTPPKRKVPKPSKE